MTAPLTHERFQECLNDRFRAEVEGQTFELRLTKVEVSSAADTSGRAPFSLVFVGPREPMLSQRLYRLEHERMDVGDIFLVPVGADEEGTRYEAVFN